MKRFVTILTLLFSFSIIQAQSSNWKVIDSPEKSGIKFEFESSDGTILGRYITTNEIFSSKNNGQTWNSIIIPSNLTDLNYLSYRQDSLGKIYIFESYSNEIYILDGNELKLFHELDFFDNIEDLKFLNNGNYLIASSEWIKLFDKSSKELGIRNWDIYDAVILPSKINTKNYVVVSDFTSFDDVLYTFDDNLVFDTASTVLSEPFYRLERNKDRIFSDNEYSDDKGLTWIEMPDLDFFSEIVVGADGKLYSLANDDLMISADNGNSFINKNLPYYVDEVSANQLNRIIVATTNCNSGLNSISLDEAKTWSDLKSSKLSNDIDNFTANVNENIFTEGCEDLFVKDSATQNWVTKKILNSDLYDLSDFIALSNQEVITFDTYNDYLYVSKDNGKNWEIRYDKSINNTYIPNFVEKKNVIFTQEPYSVGYSTDLGKSWKIFDTINYSTRSLSKFTSNLNFYLYDNFDEVLEVRNFNNFNVTKSIPFTFLGNRYFRDYETTFSGDTIVVLTALYDFNDNYDLEIFKSFDGGITFNSSLVKKGVLASNDELRNLYIDHNGNMTITNNKNIILLSKDFGKTWSDISPNLPNKLYSINDLKVSYDNYLYVATNGAGLLKYQEQLSTANEELEVKPLILKPNPTNGLVYFSSEFLNSTTEISIFDVCGKLTMKNGILNSNNIDLSTYLPGMYYIKLKSDNKNYIGKVVKL